MLPLLDHIEIIRLENEKIITRVCDLRGLISTKIEVMVNALKEARSVVTALDPTGLETAETLSYLLCGHISILESPKSIWDSTLSDLKKVFANIFQFL